MFNQYLEDGKLVFGKYKCVIPKDFIFRNNQLEFAKNKRYLCVAEDKNSVMIISESNKKTIVDKNNQSVIFEMWNEKPRKLEKQLC